MYSLYGGQLSVFHSCQLICGNAFFVKQTKAEINNFIRILFSYLF